MRTWIVLAVLYGLFFGWYTSFGGPLRPDEIEGYIRVLTENGADPTRLARWQRFMETDTGDDFAMANFIDLRAEPRQVEGVAPGESSEDVLRRYTEPFLGQALQSAAHPIFFGSAAGEALDIWGIEGANRWSNAGIVRYRSRRDLMEQAIRAQGSDIHRFKIAAMEKTIAFPVDPFISPADPRFLLALILLVIGLALALHRARTRAKATG